MAQTRPLLRHATRRVLLPLLLLLALGAGLRRGTPAPAPAHTLALPGQPVALALASDHVFVLATDAALWRLDRAPDRLTRLLPADHGGVASSPALTLDPRRQRLFVADPGDGVTPSVVHILDSRTGAVLGTVRAGHGAAALAVDVRQGHLLVANAADGTVSVLDARSGAVLRTTPVGLLPQTLAVDEQTARAFVAGPVAPLALAASGVPPWGDSGGPAGLVGVLDTRSGTLLHVDLVGSGPDSLAVDARTARVFVLNSFAGTVSVLDARDGTVLRTVAVGGFLTALALDAPLGRVYVANAEAGTVNLLDAASGALLHTVHIAPAPGGLYGLPDALAVDEAHGLVYLSADGPTEPGPNGPTPQGNGTLDVLNARTGAILQHIAVGVAPRAVAVAEESGRVVVANGGGLVVHPADDWLAQGIQRLHTWLPGLGRVSTPAPTRTDVPGSVSVIAAGT